MVFQRGFVIQSKEKINEARLKGLETRRSPELKKAWAEQQKIRDLYVSGVEPREIAKQYKIDTRACNRIINDQTQKPLAKD